MMERYDACLKCSICELHCPVMRVDARFPGPKNGGPGAERLRAVGSPVDEEGLWLCLGCRTCDTVCPSGLNPAMLVNKATEEKVLREGPSLRDWVLTHTPLFGPLAVATAPMANAVLSGRPIRATMERALRIDRRRPFPVYARQSFRRWFAMHRSPFRQKPAPNGQVVFFHGCSTNFLTPEIGRQTVAILEHNGFEVIVPPQRCCGLPLMANGQLEEARTWGSYNVEQLRPYAEKGIPILITSTSCSLTIKQEYTGHMGIAGADAISSNCYDISEFLWLCHEEGRLKTDFQAIAQEIPYHQPCHQRVQGIGTPALRLLGLIPGVRSWNLQAGCCGSAGTHGFKQEKYDLSMAVGQTLGEAILATGATRAVSDCEACRWQLEHLTGLPAVHPITVLWEAYGLGSKSMR